MLKKEYFVSVSQCLEPVSMCLTAEGLTDVIKRNFKMLHCAFEDGRREYRPLPGAETRQKKPDRDSKRDSAWPPL